jgi:hypothetical protein
MFGDIFRRRFKYMAINDLFSLFYLPILWFAFNQMRDLSGNTSYLAGNAVATILLMIMALATPILLTLAWYRLGPKTFQ